MNDLPDGTASRRSNVACAGIVALNLITPGLGLIRVGAWREGLSLLLAPFAWLALMTFGIGRVPITSYQQAIFALTTIICSVAALYISAAILTWQRSKYKTPIPIWSRLYSLLAIAISDVVMMQIASFSIHHFYKPLYAPGESMAPTIEKGDRFIADMRWHGPLKRGEIVLFRGPDSVRVSRIAALPGDRIAMREGVPILNGTAASQRVDGETSFMSYDGVHNATVMIERLPDELLAHRVFDVGPSEFDTMEERIVPAGHIFVLSDNRDRSADSRVPPNLAGVGMVSTDAIVGRPMYIDWSSDHARIGTRLDR